MENQTILALRKALEEAYERKDQEQAAMISRQIDQLTMEKLNRQ